MKTKKSLKTMLILGLATAVVPVTAYAVDDVTDTAYVNVTSTIESGNGTIINEGGEVKFETGNITVDGNEQSSVPPVYQKNGLYVTGSNVPSKTTLNVTSGDIAVTNNGEDAGLQIRPSQDVQSNVKTGNITSDGIGAFIYKMGDDDLNVKTGNISSVMEGIEINSYSGKSKITTGDVTSRVADEESSVAVSAKFGSKGNSLTVGKVNSEKVGVFLRANESGDLTFNSEDITAKTSGFVAYAGSDYDQSTSGKITATIDGNVTSDVGPALSAMAATHGSSTSTTVNGNVKSGSSALIPTVAIYASDMGTTSNVAVNGSVTALKNGPIPTALSIQGGFGSKNTLNVNGNVNAKGDDSLGVLLNGSSCNYVNIDGDVNAGEVGIYADVYENEDNKPQVLVTGTVSASKAGVLLDGSTTKDNLDLTVWKIVPNESGNVVEEGRIKYITEEGDPEHIVDAVFEYEGPTEVTSEFEKSIKYIIKVEQPNNGAKLIALDANGKALDLSHGYEIAYEGDKVILRALPEKGYRITAAYNGLDGEKVALTQDANGNYYINVPKGGGVYLSALFEKIKYNISYDLAGGSWNGNSGIITFQSAYGDKIALISAPTRPGYRFVCWKGSQYQPGDIYEVLDNHTFTAVWEKIEKQNKNGCKCKGNKCCCKEVKTGDETNATTWIYGVFASVFGFMMSLFGRKSSKTEE